MNCVICGYNKVNEQYYDNNKRIPTHTICQCCGFESGFDDGYKVETQQTFQNEYRIKWIKNGFNWFYLKVKPDIWNYDVLLLQLQNIGINIDDYHIKINKQ